MKWQILILSQPSRAKYLERLLGMLESQIMKRLEEVEIQIRIFDRNFRLGENRQMMLNKATADYVCFVDDDDLVAWNYVDRILPLLDGVDYVGFRVQTFTDGVPLLPTIHSIRYDRWHADERGHYRDISHLNPIRRELALMAPMFGGRAEDARWADGIRRQGVVKTEHFVDEVMYFYYYRTRKEDGGLARTEVVDQSKMDRLDEIDRADKIAFSNGPLELLRAFLRQRREEVERL